MSRTNSGICNAGYENMLRNIFSNLPKGPLSVMVLAWGAVDCTNGDATDGEAGLVPGFEGAGWGGDGW